MRLAHYGARVTDARSDVDTVVSFNDAINARDLDALRALMTDDHRFIDSGGTIVEGKAACAEAWRGFFVAFPDYCNVFEELRAGEDGIVDIDGASVCSVAELDGPARWRALVRDGQITFWQVLAFSD